MNRNSNRQSTAPWFVLAAILAIGALTVWLVIFLIATMVYSTFAASGVRGDQLVFTIEGQPLLQSYTPEGLSTGNQFVYRTLDGRKIEDPDALHLSEESNAGELPPAAKPHYRYDNWMYRIRAFLQTRPAPVAWYLIHDGRADGRAHFVGYQPQSKQLIGYLGRKGFRTDVPPSEEQFSLSTSLLNNGGVAPSVGATTNEPTSRFASPALYLVSDGSLFKIDLGRQSVEPVAMPDEVVSVGTYSELTAVPDERHATYKDRLLVRLAKELHVLSMEGEPLRVIPLTEPMQRANISLLGTTVDELIVVARGEDYYSPRDLFWIGRQGEVKRGEQVTLYRRPPNDNRASAWVATSVMPMPVVLFSVSILAAALDDRTAEKPTFALAYAELASRFWLPLGVLLFVSAALAFVVYRRQRAMSGNAAMAWAIFVFLLGLPGFVGYWTHRRRPARACCERCGATVPRDRATCPACAAEFPPPALKGIEVFA